MARSNRLINEQANAVLDQLKNDIANGFGVALGGETTSRQNGSVGGEMTKQLVQFAEKQLTQV
ncbi:alpha/beta-type small acid-soluble spore protein [Brevibacillus choshinensis]|uniref:alpha/beta-type small acid-soluble spore protein n=1 Tax=Brevibacillus choshinensis TaxID=54911 RepID=UPI002E20916E|nr:alpha/beta-type small acid-soluble spore protein [Brevibacillus choshinensis]MED4750234.1 alpha/beta-type small acid-soluble spore protein [Brevibacillus choshinensis]MED4780821.1 alpha/beta-type small acid-soluble spore protein [Brevibacillus choshinensis]